MGQTLAKGLEWEEVEGEKRLKDTDANDDTVAGLVQAAKTIAADQRFKDVSCCVRTCCH